MILPRRFTDHQAAAELDVSVDTVRRERRRGKLGYLRVGRKIFITEDQLRDYLARQSVEPCHESNDPVKSPATGSAGAQTAMPGAGPGSTRLPDKHVTHRSAQSDFRQAELKLAAWVAKHADIRHQHPADLPLATVLTRYWLGHAKNLPSAEQARIELRYWSDFFTTDMVADLTPPRQEEFVAYLRGKGHSTGYICRILSTGRAAINRAHKRGELLAVPFIADVETAEDRRIKEPKGRPVTIDEIAALFDAAEQHHVFTFLLIACCTLARPEAILDLTVFQRDRDARTSTSTLQVVARRRNIVHCCPRPGP